MPEGMLGTYGNIQVFVARQGNLVGAMYSERYQDRYIHFPRLWRRESGFEEFISLNDPEVHMGETAISSDGRWAAAHTYNSESNASFLRIYGLEQGELQHELDIHEDRRNDSSAGRAVQFSPDGRHLAVAGDKGRSIQVWNTEAGFMLWKGEPRETYGVNSISFSPDGESLAIATWGEPLEMRETRTGELLRTFQSPGHRPVHVAISPDGQHVATAGNWPRPRIKIWNVRSGEVVGTLVGHATGARAEGIAWSPDSRYLVTVTGAMYKPGQVLLWDLLANGIGRTDR